VKEDLEDEVANFAAKHWQDGEIYLDPDLSFFKAIGGGDLNQFSLIGFLMGMLSPSNPVRVKAGETSKKTPGNMKGEGLITGGVYVIRHGGAVEYAHLEAEIGDTAPIDEVIAAAQRASQ